MWVSLSRTSGQGDFPLPDFLLPRRNRTGRGEAILLTRAVLKTKAQEGHELAREFSTPSRKLVSVLHGDKIVEPLLFEKENYFHKFNELKLQSALRPLLKQAMDSKQSFNFEDLVKQACQDLGLDNDWATRYFDSPRYKRWYADRVREIEAHLGLSVEYLASKHKDNLEGSLKLSSSQLESAKELGDRIWPKVSKIEHEISQKESTTLDDMPDFDKKVEEYEKKLKEALPLQGTNAA